MPSLICKHALGTMNDLVICSSPKIKSTQRVDKGYLVKPSLCDGICPYINHGEDGKPTRKLNVKPSTTTKARNYISTLSQHVLNNFAEVPAEVREQRQAICNGCDKRDPVKNACKVCGCKLEKTFLGDKLAWAVSSCPLGKWQAYHENPPESGGISGVENPKVSFENSMTDGNKLLLDAIRFDHENLHPQVIPGLRFNSTIIEQA